MKKYLYTLLLQDGCYYVGRTSKVPYERLKEHISGVGSKWTRIHKPINFVKIQSGQYDGFDEDTLTKRYMANYGINNVRGGSYSNIELSQDQIINLNREIYHNKGVCLNCGASDHWVSTCKNKPMSSNTNDTPTEINELTNIGKTIISETVTFFKQLFKQEDSAKRNFNPPATS